MPNKTRKPHVAYLTAQYPAVSHTFILREAEALRALGFEVDTCSIRQTGLEHHQGAEEKSAAATTFYVLNAAKKPLTLLGAQIKGLMRPGAYFGALKLAWRTAPPGLRGMLYQYFYFAEATVLAAHLRARGVEHLHNHFADSSANVAMLTSALSGIPYSYTLHGPAEIYEPHRWQLREKTARARFVACISHFCRSQAMYFSDPTHWNKIKIIHCGVLPEQYEHPSTEADSGTHLVFVGRLTAIKGVRVLLKAFATAQATRSDLRLTLVGDGDERPALETLAASLGDAVRFVGYKSQSEVAEILSSASALVLPSFAEGLPVVLMEAMASGKPVVTTQLAGVGELVEDGVSGFIVPASDEASLADRIGRISDDPELRRRMGAVGRKKVQAEFDIRIEAARIAALFAGQWGEETRPEPLEEGAL